MRLRIVFNGSVPKDDGADAINEDQTATDESRQRFAVSDGASESYDSARWARLLANAWVAGGMAVSRQGLEQVISEYERACDPSSLSWSKRGAFDRGSFATLLGVTVRGAAARIVAMGDSMVLGLPIDGATLSFPYSLSDEFDRRPLLLSTSRDANNALFDRSVARGCITRWPLHPGAVLLLMTDALGQWLLRRGASASSCAVLLAIRTPEDLHAFVRSEQASGAMRRDDTTLLHLSAEEA